MENKIEGLLLRKIEYKDRHIIGQILLRSGQKVSVVFYGARGAKVRRNCSLLELGQMLKIELSGSRRATDLFRAKEWTSLWMHKNIRENVSAFYLLCAFCEMVGILSPEGGSEIREGLGDGSSNGEGTFKVLSNALYFLDENMVKGEKINNHLHLLVFLSKLIYEMGIYPDLKKCQFCEVDLRNLKKLVLVFEKGGFSCFACLNQQERGERRDGRKLFELLGQLRAAKYSEFIFLHKNDLSLKDLSHTLLNFFLFQFQLDRGSFRALPLVL
jgi:recombinational DNA repair protein (RecF pathway)